MEIFFFSCQCKRTVVNLCILCRSSYLYVDLCALRTTMLVKFERLHSKEEPERNKMQPLRTEATGKLSTKM